MVFLKSREHIQTGYKTSHTLSLFLWLQIGEESSPAVAVSVPAPKALILFPVFQLCGDIKQKLLTENKQKHTLVL